MGRSRIAEAGPSARMATRLHHALVLVWVLIVLGMVGSDASDSKGIGNEVQTLDDAAPAHPVLTPHSHAPPRKKAPSWANMAAKDKAMAAKQGEVSHFLGAMSSKEASFAKRQGAQNQMFALSRKDRDLAHRQTTVSLGKSGEKSLRELTTPDKYRPSDVKLSHLASIRRKALQRAKKLRKELAAMKKKPAHRKQSLTQSLDSIQNAITESTEEDEDMDLGESMGVGVGKHEKVVKAEQKAKIEMAADTKRHEAEIKTFRREMKEMVKKANRVRNAALQKSQKFVPKAVSEYNQKAGAKKRMAQQKNNALISQAMSAFKRAEADSIKAKQELSLRITGKKNEVQGHKSKRVMESKSHYQKQLVVFQNARTKAIARYRKQLVEATTELQNKARSSAEGRVKQARGMKMKFETMTKKMQARMKKELSKLKAVEAKGRTSAEKAWKAAQSKGKKAITMIKMKTGAAKKGAGIMLKESKSDSSKADKEKDRELKTKLVFKAKEKARKKKVKKKVRKLKKEENKFDLNAKKEQKEVDAKEKMREKAMAKKGSLSAAEFKKRQMKWLAMVKKTAKKNCHDAKREAILRTRASRFATDRLSRMSKDMAKMKANVLADVKSKGKKAYDAKERAGKKLKKIVAAQGKAMAGGGKYDATAVQKAAAAFAKVSGPKKSEGQIIKEASKKAADAKKSAAKHTKIWAKKQATKTGKNLKKTANSVCHKEQMKYETVRYRVRKRLGLANEGEHKALIKGQFKDKKWALSKVTVMLGKKKKMNEASEKKKNQLSEKEKKAEKNAEKKQKAKLQAIKEKQKKFSDAAKKKEAAAKAKMKEAAAKKKAKIDEAKKLMAVSEKSYKKQVKQGRQKLKQAMSKIMSSSKKEESSINARMKKAMALQKGGKSTLKADIEKAKKKAKENETKARQREKARIQKAGKQRDSELKKRTLVAKNKMSELNVKIKNGKTAADKRMLKAKLVLSRKKQEAKKILAEALKGGAGAKQNAIYEAKLKAQKLLGKSNKVAKKAMKDARKIFVAKVKKATAKYLANIKATKAKIQGSLGMMSLLQLGESRIDSPTKVERIVTQTLRLWDEQWKTAFN